jgi:type VI secretion system Hcp family effector
MLSVTGQESWEYRLHLQGIEGEDTGGYAGWIVATGFRQMIERPTGPDGRATGRPSVTPITIYKHGDTASPKLYDHCIRGTRIEHAVIVMNHKTNQARNMRLEMEDVIIASVETAGANNAPPVETVKLVPRSITWRYRADENSAPVTSEYREGRE